MEDMMQRASLEDARTIREIYAHYVLASKATVEETRPIKPEIPGSIRITLQHDFRVAEDACAGVIGFSLDHTAVAPRTQALPK